MRTTTAGELATLAATTRRVTLRFKVQNGSGTMIDLTTWLESIKPDEDIDRPIAGLIFEFRRDNGATQSLSPLRTDSTLNRLDDGTTYSPILDLNRIVTFEAATTDIGATVVAGDYKMLFKGTIDIINFEHSPVSVICRDLGAPLVDRFVETEANYGTGGGRAIELVKQDILDASFGAGVVPVITIGTPAFSIVTYQQQKMSLSDAEQALDQLRGWDSRYWWNEGTGTYRYTFQEPPRTKTTPDYTFGPSGYYDVRSLDLDLTGIKNVVQVSYRNAADQGNRAVVTVSDAPSIAKYGRRFLYMKEADNSPIDTTAEATAMANAALSDLKEPKASLEIELPFFWPCQLWDLYRFSANGKHFDSDQDLAVSSFSHELSPGRHRTVVKLRGKPAGGYAIWLQRGGVIGGGVGGGTQAFPPYPYITPLNTEANELVWNLRFNASNGSGGGGVNLIYTVKLKKDFASQTTLSSGNATAFPLDLSVTRDPKQNAVLTFRVTDTATGLFAEEAYPIPAYSPYIDSTGFGLTGGTTDSGGRPINRHFSKPLVASPDTLDGVPDGSTYGRPILTRLSGGKPLIDFSEGIHIAKNIDNISDGATRKAVTAIDGAGKAIIDLSQAHSNKTLDNITDGSTYRRVTSVNGSGKVTQPSIEAASVGPVEAVARFRCKVNNSGSQSIADSTFTNINFNTELWDIGSLHDNVTNNDRMTVPTGGDTGVWPLEASVAFAANATGRREVRILHYPVGGGVATEVAKVVMLGFSNGGVGPVISLHGVAQPPAVGDYFVVEVWQNSTASLNVLSASFFSTTHLW